MYDASARRGRAYSRAILRSNPVAPVKDPRLLSLKALLEGSEPEPRPSLHLQGRWLEKAGFPIGPNVRVQVTPRRLVVELMKRGSDGAES
ncbi:SymE family type I addiction module toxin [Steroidobacter cummioxidans]|uniref:SymE family type I addiction module toxin n=1 Tax=Steroidobacter cummioxidans TaxID=1803913 RepID=UPI0039C95815